jgi:SAM-dependent methyltransferase
MSASPPEVTDWSSYYRSVQPTARLTRRYTTREIIKALALHRLPAPGARILEFGGANSCFLDAIVKKFHPADYAVADTNDYGLNLLQDRAVPGCSVSLYKDDVLAPAAVQAPRFDLVFSVGLIEHFDPPRTALAVQNHFRMARPGGLVLLTFPCPTMLYRSTRTVLEKTSLWRFPDERALQPPEVLAAIQGLGQVLFQKTLWPLMLTQHLVLVRAGKQPSE